MDPCTGWPFFIDHGTRRTTWDDPRYSGHYDTRPGLTLGQGFNDSSYPGGVLTSATYPEIYNNPLNWHNKHFDLDDNIYAGQSRPRSTTSRQILQQENILNSTKFAMEKESPSTLIPSLQMDMHTTSKQQLGRLNNVVINPEVTVMGRNDGAFHEYKVAQGRSVVKNLTMDSVVNQPEIVSGVTAALPATNAEKLSQPIVFSDAAIKSSPEIFKINEIAQKSVDLEQKLASFEGTRGSKEYILIEESLMSLLLLLDKVETNGDADIRKARKSTVCRIQQLLSNLEEKAKKY